MGSATLVSDYKGDEYQRIEYTPYGETWVEKTQNTGLEFLPYKFTAKEMDEETGLYYYGARYLDPRYSRWLSTDPALGEYVPANRKDAENLPGMGGVFNHINGNLYHYAGNNPVKFVDPDGNFAVVGSIVVWGFNAGLLTYGIGASRSDEYGFALRHQIIASDIGKVKTGVGCTNISTNSTRFSAAVGNDDFQEGGQVNAIRHALWSSTISSNYGADIAKEATNSHESNSNLSGFSFSKKAEADSRFDLLNNEIGISLGSDNKKSSMKHLTGQVLDIFHRPGD